MRPYRNYCTAVVVLVLAALPTVTAHASSGQEFEDSSSFKLYVRETFLGNLVTSLDAGGNYARKLSISMAGQTIEYEMHVERDSGGGWENIRIVNPTIGDITGRIYGGEAEYRMNGKRKTVKLPDGYILYDDYGILYESVMLKRYDMQKKGKQAFKRFRIPEIPSLTDELTEVEIDYRGRQIREVGGREKTFRIFGWKTFGVSTEYWVDEDFKICKIDAKTEYSVSVREGFEELLDFEEETTGLAKLKRTVEIPMRDGVKLATDLYFPVGAMEDLPVVLIRTPYKKEMQELDGYNWARNGYVCAVQDVRGRFASGGDWEPFMNEGEDGYDTVEWIAARDWCSGKVGMIGGSYLGWVQLWASVQKPPHLVTIIPNVAPPDPFYNIPYEYGSFFTLGALWWAEIVESEATGELSGRRFYEIGDRAYDKILKTLPVIEIDREIFGRENHYWRKWIEHNVNDSYWERANFIEKLEDLDIPVFLQSGWFDGDGIGTKLSYLGLKKSRNRNIKMIIGPWGHTDQSSSQISGKDVGKEAAIDLRALYLRWFDYWLKGIENGIIDEPLVQLYAINSEIWLKSNTYPLPGTEFTKYYISSAKGANSLKGDGTLAPEPPIEGMEFDNYTYNPGDPTPSVRQRFKEAGRKSYDRITESRKDILVYESGPLEEPLTIAGPVSFKLYASSSAKDTDWFVAFEVINEEGELIPLGKGTLRARFRNSTHAPELLEEGRVYEYTIDLWHTGITLEKDYRMRVEVTSAFFPMFSRNLNTGGHNETESRYVKAKQRIYHSSEYPSYLLLPLVEPGDYLSHEVSKVDTVPGEEVESGYGAGGGEEDAAGIEVPGKILDSYAGRYRLKPEMILEVKRKGKGLSVQATGQSEDEIFPESEASFRSRKVSARITFVRDEGGKVKYVLLEQGGYKFRARNLAFPEQQRPAERRAIRLDSALLESYAGRYGLAPNSVLTIESEGAGLFAQLTGQPRIEIYPEAETEFFYTIVDAQITFLKDASGNVTCLVLHQNGMDLQADRLEE